MQKPTRQVDCGNLTGFLVIIKSHVRLVVLVSSRASSDHGCTRMCLLFFLAVWMQAWLSLTRVVLQV